MPLRDMKPIRERNPVAVGAISLLVIAALLLVSSQANRLPILGGGATYAAEFTEVGGLKKGDDVRLAGVRVGEVEGLELAGETVRVKFRVTSDRDKLGSQTGASVRIKSLLGTMYLSLEPAGGGELERGAVIPADRTTPPYDIVQAFSGLTETTQQIDNDQLAHALDTLNDVAAKTPEEFRDAVSGVTALSTTLAKRDQELKTLLENVDSISAVLADRNTEFVRLFQDGSVLFEALAQRRDAIRAVLENVTQMSREIRALVKDTRADLKPTLERLDGVVTVLRKNEANITKAIEQLPAYYAMVATNTGNGPWMDSFVYNLLSLLGVPGGL